MSIRDRVSVDVMHGWAWGVTLNPYALIVDLGRRSLFVDLSRRSEPAVMLDEAADWVRVAAAFGVPAAMLGTPPPFLPYPMEERRQAEALAALPVPADPCPSCPRVPDNIDAVPGGCCDDDPADPKEWSEPPTFAGIRDAAAVDALDLGTVIEAYAYGRPRRFTRVEDLYHFGWERADGVRFSAGGILMTYGPVSVVPETRADYATPAEIAAAVRAAAIPADDATAVIPRFRDPQ